ncbi:MAG: lipase maturation factor family protein [Bryobacteraceae bacterium]
MTWNPSDGYWLTRLVFERSLGVAYLIAFLNAVNQFKPLAGERGLLPAHLYLKDRSFNQAPGLFVFFPNDRAFTLCAWAGVVLSASVVAGIAAGFGLWLSMTVWGAIWVLYLSFVNAGQTFYGFGWESILLEAGFYAIFLGNRAMFPPAIPIWLLRWLEFRVMFGAGLIKLRGDPCWRDLTCLDYHYETQPMPNPLSWFFHWGPEWTKKGGVLFNHLAELILPFGYFCPQPVATIAGAITIVFQLTIFASGNLSWLNFLTMVLAIPALDLSAFAPAHATHPPSIAYQALMIALAILVAALSVQPILNMISPRQIMNTVYNRLHLVGTYGAFGSITRPRYEVIVEGTDEVALIPSTRWREYEFKGKPGAAGRMPPQIAPYHLRLDWLMWFAALSSYYQHPWFLNFLAKLLENDRAVLGLLRSNPFPDAPPTYVRANLYEYRFTTPGERARTGQWWTREFEQIYFPPVSLQTAGFRGLLERQGWLQTEHSH